MEVAPELAPVIMPFLPKHFLPRKQDPLKQREEVRGEAKDSIGPCSVSAQVGQFGGLAKVG